MHPADVLARVRMRGFVCWPAPDGAIEVRYFLPGEPPAAAIAEVKALLGQHLAAVWDLLCDPRPDLTTDHALWRTVLLEAARLDPHPGQRDSLYGLLHGLRCCGARLKWRRGHLFLDIHPVCADGGWTEEALRQRWLLPQLPAIRRVFAAAEARLTPDATDVSWPKPVDDSMPGCNDTTGQVPTGATSSGSTAASEVGQLAAVLRRQGWAVAESTRLGCQLILARNQRAAEQALRRYPDRLVLLGCEWPALLACGTPDEVELLFAVKQHLGGVWFLPDEEKRVLSRLADEEGAS